VYTSQNLYFGRTRLNQLLTADVTDTPDGNAALLERAWLQHVHGSPGTAIQDYLTALEQSDQHATQARMGIALADLRIAETQNCANGTASSCIVPFDTGGAHANPDAVLDATIWLDAVLTTEPDFGSAIWLLNVAHMAAQTWPDGLLPAHVVPDDFFADEVQLLPFVNESLTIKLDRSRSPAGGSAIEDIDGDGRLDLVTSTVLPDGDMTLMLQNADGTFCDASAAAGLRGMGGILSFSAVDYDNDGDIDLFAPRGAWMEREGLIRPSLLMNDGTGQFTDVAVAAGLADPGPSQVSAWADFNGDGWLDLFLGRERAYDTTPASSLYLSQGDGTFIDIWPEFGLNLDAVVKGASWGDVDGDNDPDLMITNLTGPEVFLRNDDGRLVDATAAVGMQNTDNSFGTWFFDYDQDGDSDLFMSGIVPVELDNPGHAADDWYWSHGSGAATVDSPLKLLRNDDGRFVDVTANAGLADVESVMGGTFTDLDADGLPDLMLGTGLPNLEALMPNVAYVNRGAAGFRSVTTSSRLGHLAKGHGIASADLDEDGDEDLLMSLGGMYPGDGFRDGLFVNPHGQGGAVLELEGVSDNRAAIGARVRVTTTTQTSWSVVGEGGSFGHNSYRVEVALRGDATIVGVTITWPNGDVEEVSGVEGGQLSRIRQGEGVVDTRPLAGL
jgi:hypothetical protein